MNKILRKYVPESIPAEEAKLFLTKKDYAQLRAEISKFYNIPEEVLDISNLVENEDLIPEIKKRLSNPQKKDYEELFFKKKKLSALCRILGNDLYDHFWDHNALVNYAREIGK